MANIPQKSVCRQLQRTHYNGSALILSWDVFFSFEFLFQFYLNSIFSIQFLKIESISDPLKHLVTTTSILLPREYFKNVLKRWIFSWLRQCSGSCRQRTCAMSWVQLFIISYFFLQCRFYFFLSKFFSQFFFKISSVL